MAEFFRKEIYGLDDYSGKIGDTEYSRLILRYQMIERYCNDVIAKVSEAKYHFVTTRNAFLEGVILNYYPLDKGDLNRSISICESIIGSLENVKAHCLSRIDELEKLKQAADKKRAEEEAKKRAEEEAAKKRTGQSETKKSDTDSETNNTKDKWSKERKKEAKLLSSRGFN